MFLCIRCAGIHRNLGVHISRVKSVNLDSWTTEQLEVSETSFYCSYEKLLFRFNFKTEILFLFFHVMFRVSKSGETSEQQSFGNVICQVIFDVHRPTRTIRQTTPVNLNFSGKFYHLLHNGS